VNRRLTERGRERRRQLMEFATRRFAEGGYHPTSVAEIVTGLERLRLGILATARWSAGHRDLYGLTQFAATQSQFAPAIRKGREIAVGDTIKHVREGIARGLIRDVDPAYIAHAILGVTTQLVGTFIHHRGTDPDEVAQAAAAIVLEGILCDTAVGAGSKGDLPGAGRSLSPAS
jgi:AcrR family transcriptional regulator